MCNKGQIRIDRAIKKNIPCKTCILYVMCRTRLISANDTIACSMLMKCCNSFITEKSISMKTYKRIKKVLAEVFKLKEPKSLKLVISSSLRNDNPDNRMECLSSFFCMMDYK